MAESRPVVNAEGRGEATSGSGEGGCAGPGRALTDRHDGAPDAVTPTCHFDSPRLRCTHAGASVGLSSLHRKHRSRCDAETNRRHHQGLWHRARRAAASTRQRVPCTTREPLAPGGPVTREARRSPVGSAAPLPRVLRVRLQSRAAYWIAFTRPKIGRYMATIIPPTTVPRITIRAGSRTLRRFSTATSTSSS